MRRSFLLVGPAAVALLAAVLSAPGVAGLASRPQRVPPPTPVPPSGSPSPFPTALETPTPSTHRPELSAESVALVDIDTGQVLLAQRPDLHRPIASTTKIMTALLVLEAVKPGDVVTASANAVSQTGAELGLKRGEKITVRNLLYALLLQSANDAAVALAEHVAGSVEDFLAEMNDRAHQLGARDTHFESPNGLDDRGYSTARDMALLTVEAYRNPTFTEVVSRKVVTIPAPKGKPRHIQNRNALLWLYPDAIGVKTGFTSAAGFCLVGAAERDGLRLAAVVLGAPGDAFSDAAAALDFGFRTFERRLVVQEGEEYGPLEVDGREVEVEADVSLELLLRRAEEPDEVVVQESGLGLPLAAGERVGEVIVRDGETELGRVPLVTLEPVRPPPEPERPWWERAWDSVRGFFQRLFEAVFG
jgi:serine-type D-Ala-D-Ala carboxypeptidase (penicillin-binding protein 5/6)